MKQTAFALACLLLPVLAWADASTVSCTPPTTNTDGSTLTDLTGFRFYYGTQANSLGQSLTVSTPAICRATIDNLAAGTWYFTVTALAASGIESQEAPVVSRTLSGTTPPPVYPAAPANESRSQTCAAPLVGSWTQIHGWSSTAAPTCWTADPWSPASAPAGVCASPPAPVTTGRYAYCVTGTAALPAMTSFGYVKSGIPCGPAVRTVNGVKFCQIAEEQADKVTFCNVTNGDPTLAKGVWARTP